MRAEIVIAIGIIWLSFAIPSVLSDIYTGIPAGGKIYDEMFPCTLINEEPWYSCERKLRIVIFDTRLVPGYSSLFNEFYFNPDEPALGWSYFNRLPISDQPFDLIILGNQSMNKAQGKWNDYYPLTAFQHELKHIKCHCNFHKWLDDMDDDIEENYPNKWSKSLLR